MNWKIGDVVVLKSGSPRLTVTAIGKDAYDRPYVVCAWFVAGEKKSDDFPPDALVAIVD